MINLNLQEVVFGQKAMAGSIVGGRADMQVRYNRFHKTVSMRGRGSHVCDHARLPDVCFLSPLAPLWVAHLLSQLLYCNCVNLDALVECECSRACSGPVMQCNSECRLNIAGPVCCWPTRALNKLMPINMVDAKFRINMMLLLLLLLQEMLEFCGDKGIAPMVQVMKLSEVSSVQHLKTAAAAAHCAACP